MSSGYLLAFCHMAFPRYLQVWREEEAGSPVSLARKLLSPSGPTRFHLNLITFHRSFSRNHPTRGRASIDEFWGKEYNFLKKVNICFKRTWFIFIHTNCILASRDQKENQLLQQWLRSLFHYRTEKSPSPPSILPFPNKTLMKRGGGCEG